MVTTADNPHPSSSPEPAEEPSITRPPKARGDVRALLAALRRFNGRGPRQLGGLAVLAFATGMLEAATLALITVAAVGHAGDGGGTFLGSFRLGPGLALGLATLCLVFRILVGIFQAWATSHLLTNAGVAARQSLLGSYFGASFEARSSARLAALQERLTTYVDQIQGAFGSLTQLVSSSLALASFGIVALLVDPLALFALAVVGVLVSAVQRPFARQARKTTQAYARLRSRYAESVTESALLNREMAVFGVTSTVAAQLRETDRQVAHFSRKSSFLAQLNTQIYYALAFGLAIGGLAAYGRAGDGGLASIAAVALIVLRSLSYGQTLLSTLHAVSQQQPYVDQLLRWIQNYEENARSSGTVELERIRQVRFEDVDFSYDGTPALTGVNLVITEGETIGVVGRSGAGKTTFLNLLLRLYQPTAGRISIADIDLSSIEHNSWHSLVSIVPQEPRLIHGTIADNIRFMRDISDESVRQAATDAHIADFIQSLPHGYESMVEELGHNFSGGQRQRICIARALAGHPALLVLDEPTSALDGVSESTIQTTLSELKGTTTMVIVSHRLSTLSDCDKIIIFEDGKIIDFAPPSDLVARSTYFRQALEQTRR